MSRKEALRTLLLAAVVLLATISSACSNESGNGAGNGPSIPSLEGCGSDRGDSVDAVALPAAPSERHGKLARLLGRARIPLVNLVDGSFQYGGWDGDASEFYAEDEEAVKNAPIPAVTAKFLSSKFERVNDPGEKPGTTVTDLATPQTCQLWIVEAAEASMAGLLQERMATKLTERGYEQLEPLRLASSQAEAPLEIPRYFGRGEDVVMIAYFLVVDDIFLFAFETEPRPPIVGPGGEEIRLPIDQPTGGSLGAQLLVLLQSALAR